MHNYLAMRLDFSTPNKVKIDMKRIAMRSLTNTHIQQTKTSTVHET